MADFCQDSKKAVVKIKMPNSSIKKVAINKPPIKVNCSPPDGVRITIAGQGVDSDWSAKYIELSYVDQNGTTDDAYTLQTPNCTTDLGCGSSSPNPNALGRFYQARIFKNGQLLYTFLIIGFYAVSLKEVKKIRAIFSIENASGKVFEQEFDKCPEYEIECDDNCPEGQIKMKSDRPPGYCCMPCSNVKSTLTAIKGKLK